MRPAARAMLTETGVKPPGMRDTTTAPALMSTRANVPIMSVRYARSLLSSIAFPLHVARLPSAGTNPLGLRQVGNVSEKGKNCQAVSLQAGNLATRLRQSVTFLQLFLLLLGGQLRQ